MTKALFIGGLIETSAAKVSIADDAVITTYAPNGKTGTWLIDPQDYTIAASGGDITGSQLSTNLGSNNVTILSSSGGTAGNGDINVNDNVSWSANTLTLTAARDININAVMTASGTSALTMNPAAANGTDGAVAGGAVKVGFNTDGTFKGMVDFPSRSGTGFLTINGNGYTVINSLGAEGSVTATDLQGMSGNLAGNYALGTDIDASATSSWNSGAGFAPVGGFTDQFTGTFDGLGHTITGLTIRPDTNYIGLFGWTNTGSVIRNVGLVGGSVTSSSYYVGGLVGYDDSGTITNSYAGGTGMTTALMQQQANFSGWDFTNTWRIYEGDTYPLLKSFLTPLTVTANAASKIYDGLAYSGGNGVTYSLSGYDASKIFGSLTYSGSSQGAINAGSYTITPSGLYSNQQGYDIISYANGALTINPAPLTITADDKNKTYGDANPTLTATYSGLVNGETSTVVSGLTLNTTATTTSNAGNYTITAADGTASNYTITYNNGVLTITAPSAASSTASASAQTTASSASTILDMYQIMDTENITDIKNFNDTITLGGALDAELFTAKALHYEIEQTVFGYQPPKGDSLFIEGEDKKDKKKDKDGNTE